MDGNAMFEFSGVADWGLGNGLTESPGPGTTIFTCDVRNFSDGSIT